MTPVVNVVLMDWPDTKAKEIVTENEDGSFTIFINARISTDAQAKSYWHGMEHIKGLDFQREDVQQIEALAHAQSQHSPQVGTQDQKPVIMTGNQFLKRIHAIKRRQRRIRKELARVEKDMKKLERYGVDFFARAEEEHLYGGL